MDYAREQTTGFTVTFRSVILQAFTKTPLEPLPAPPVAAFAPRLSVVRGSLAERVRAAFTGLPPNQTEIKVIGALLRLPGAAPDVLNEACGWRQPIWHTHFGLLCQRRVEWLWPAGVPRSADVQALTGMLAVYRPGRRSFAFRAEAARALRALPVDWGAGGPDRRPVPNRG